MLAHAQGDDYILYCHPTKQKTPRSDHLREWYLRMLRIAQEEGVVTHLSNLYDTFFPGGRDHRIERPSVTQVPYFEGTPHLCQSAPSFHASPLQERHAMFSVGLRPRTLHQHLRQPFLC